jgi:DNA polymerase-3 subunit gamma/tau
VAPIPTDDEEPPADEGSEPEPFDEPVPASGWAATAPEPQPDREPQSAQPPAAEPPTTAEPQGAAPKAASRPAPASGGPQRYGESVVRDLLKASFIEEQQLAPRVVPQPQPLDE